MEQQLEKPSEVFGGRKGKMIQLLKAIEEARKNFKELKKDGKNPMFKNNFSTITNIFDSCKSSLEENGINVSFHTYINEVMQKDVLVLTLTHIPSGEVKTSQLILTDDGKKGAQAVGSAITYHRRYMLQAMLNLEADGETDDDGTKASHTPRSNVTTLNVEPEKPKPTKNDLTAGNVTDADFSYNGEPYRIWTKKDNIELFNDVKPWSQRLKKLLSTGDKESLQTLNVKEVERILSEIESYQNKDQKWKDSVTDYIKGIFGETKSA